MSLQHCRHVVTSPPPIFSGGSHTRVSLRSRYHTHDINATIVVSKTRLYDGNRFGGDDLAIENLSTEYCDDFECTSSPAVELTVRALAKDISRGNGVWTKSLLSKNVVYKDRFCSMSGIDSFKVDFFPSYCTVSRVTIKSMKMMDVAPSSRACIEYTVEGILKKPGSDTEGLIPVEVDMTTTVTLNLLTGQIESREDSWKARSIVGKVAFSAARLAWGSVVKSREAGKKSGEFIEKSVNSVLGSLDDDTDMSNIQADPRDPMKFFQQNDSFKDDATAFMIFLLIIYIIITGYRTLFASGF